MTTTFEINPDTTTVNIGDDHVIWEDPDLDFVLVDVTTTPPIPIESTTIPLSTEFSDEIEFIDESTTIPLETVEHFDFIHDIPASSTIAGGMAVAGQDSQFNWWDIDEVSFPSVINPLDFPSTTIPPMNTFAFIASTNNLPTIEEDEWAIFNTTTIPSIPSFQQPLDPNTENDFDINDYFLPSDSSTTPIIDTILNNNNNTLPFFPLYLPDYKPDEQLFGVLKPSPTFDIPPFAWMLQLAKQNQSEIKGRQSSINKNLTTTTTMTTEIKKKKKKRVDTKKTFFNYLDHFSEYCNNKQCQYGGRLNADCLCICLPAFSGNNCERGKKNKN